MKPHLIEKLPPASQAKIKILVDRRQVAFDAARLAQNRIHDEIERQQKFERDAWLSKAKAPGPSPLQAYGMARGFIETPADPNESTLARIQADIDRAKEAYERAQIEVEKHRFLSRCNDWLTLLFKNGGGVAPFELPAPDRRPGEGYVDAVARVRRELDVLEEEYRRVELAPMPLDDLKRQITDSVDALSARIEIDPRRRDGDPAQLDRLFQNKFHRSDASGNPVTIGDGGIGFLVAINRNEIIGHLHAEADKLDITGALDDLERDAEFYNLGAARLALEAQEEALIVAAEKDETYITRRPDADPRVVMEVVDVVLDDEEPISPKPSAVKRALRKVLPGKAA